MFAPARAIRVCSRPLAVSSCGSPLASHLLIECGWPHDCNNTVRSRVEKSMNLHPCVAFCHFAITAEKPKHSEYPSALNTFGDHLRAKRLDLDLTQETGCSKTGS